MHAALELSSDAAAWRAFFAVQQSTLSRETFGFIYALIAIFKQTAVVTGTPVTGTGSSMNYAHALSSTPSSNTQAAGRPPVPMRPYVVFGAEVNTAPGDNLIALKKMAGPTTLQKVSLRRSTCCMHGHDV